MNFEDDYVNYKMQGMKGAIKKKDRHLVEENLRKEYCEENNIQYIPKEQHKQGKANEKQAYQVKDKQEARGQIKQDIQNQQDNQQEKQQLNQNQQQGQQKQKEQRGQGEKKEKNQQGNNFQEKTNNKQYYEKNQVQQNKQQQPRKQQNQKQGSSNQQQTHSHHNNQPFIYPYIEGQGNNNNKEMKDNHNNKEKRNNTNNQQNTTNNNNQQNNNTQRKNNNKQNQQDEYPHYKQVRRQRRTEKHIRSVQSDQNKLLKGKKFNHYKNNNFDDDYNRLDDENSFDDDYYFKNKENNQRQRQQRRDYDNYRNNEQGNKDYNDKVYQNNFITQYKQMYFNKQIKINCKRNKNGNWRGGRNNKKYNKNQNCEQYWTEEQIQKGKAENEIFEGIFIANEYTREKGTVKCPIFKRKVHINSFVDSNRAFHGALVAFKITKIQKTQEESDDDLEEEVTEKIPVKNTKVEKEKEIQQQKPEKEDNDEDWEDVNSKEEEEDDISEVQLIKKNYFDIKLKFQQIQSRISVSDLYVVKKKVPLTKIQQLQKAQLIGKIVGIRKNPLENRQMIGKICFNEKHGLQDKQIKTKEELINYMEKSYYVSFKCVNKRIAFFNVKNLLTFNYELDSQEPVQKFMDYVSQRYFSAKFLSWDKNSKYPLAELIKEVGVQGNIDVECEAILTENSVYDNEFSDICKEEMKAFTHDSIAKERVKRMDLTKEYICSIDPVTARDLDDALSINDLGNGIYEIGVQYI